MRRKEAKLRLSPGSSVWWGRINRIILLSRYDTPEARFAGLRGGEVELSEGTVTYYSVCLR